MNNCDKIKVRNCKDCGITFPANKWSICNRCRWERKKKSLGIEKKCKVCGADILAKYNYCYACNPKKKHQSRHKGAKSPHNPDLDKKIGWWKDGAVKFYLLEDRR